MSLGSIGGVYPFPGSLTITEVTIPTPVIFLGQGGGIRIAETPIGFTVHALPCAFPVLGSTFATFIFFVIFTAATAGF